MSLEELGKIINSDKTISSIIYHNSQQDQDDSGIVSVLNKMLSSSKSRLKALELLSANIENLSTDVVLQNAFFWLNICVSLHTNSLREIILSLIGKYIYIRLFNSYMHILYCR